MQKLPSTEELFVQSLREVKMPNAPEDLIGRLQKTEPRSRNAEPAALYALAFLVFFGLVVSSLLLRPSLSYAEVVRHFQEQTHYTVTNTRIMSDGTRTKGFAIYRSGKLWRFGATYGLEDRTVKIRSHPPSMNYVLIDKRRDPPPVGFRPDQILWKGAKPTVDHNQSWHGRKVDIFHIKGTYIDRQEWNLTEELIVDPKTKLPIQDTTMRDSGQWGDMWSYDFHDPSPSIFEVSIPKDAHVYDLRLQRKQIENALKTHPTGALFVGDEGEVVVIAPTSSAPKLKYGATLDWDFVGKLRGGSGGILHSSYDANLDLKTIVIDGKLYVTAWMMRGLSADFLNGKKQLPPTASAVLELGDKRYYMKNAFIIKTGSPQELLLSWTY